MRNTPSIYRVFSVVREGLEQPPKSSGKTAVSTIGGAKSDVIGAAGGAIDPDLQAILDAWPRLPESVRAEVLAMVRASGE